MIKKTNMKNGFYFFQESSDLNRVAERHDSIEGLRNGNLKKYSVFITNVQTGARYVTYYIVIEHSLKLNLRKVHYSKSNEKQDSSPIIKLFLSHVCFSQKVSLKSFKLQDVFLITRFPISNRRWIIR